jgi:hypothetical protein
MKEKGGRRESEQYRQVSLKLQNALTSIKN